MKNIIRLLPLLFLYILIVLCFAKNTFLDDEGRYMMFATNLSRGDYSTENEINLWNGPGYPLVLLPFISLKLPLLTAKILNAFLMFFAIFFFYRTLKLYIQEERTALIFSYLLGLYPPFFRFIHELMTETLGTFLACGFLFYLCKSYRDNNDSRKHLIISAVFLGYLALTKIIFGYIILTGLLLYSFLYVLKKGLVIKKMLQVYLLAMLFCIPYLFYTYSLTGKIFYWGNSGGLSLYWMSSPYNEDLGDWFSVKEVLANPQRFYNHIDVFKRLEKVAPVQKDQELKKYALRNIVHSPSKYFKNWLANIGRLLFNYPYSYTEQKLSTYFFLIPNMFLVVSFILCVYPAYLYRKLIPSETWHLMVFGLIFIACSSIASAYNRMLWPVVPIFSFWIIYISNRFIKVELKQ